MRREGKIHGSFVRVNKHDDFEFKNGSRGKPTNRSKVSGKCPGNTRHCYICHAGRPWSKAMCKTRGMHKLNDLDITTNHKLDKFTLNCRRAQRPVPSSPGRPDYHRSYLRYNFDPEHDDQEETLAQLGYHRSPEMMITIASFLQGMRGALEVTADVGTPDGVSDAETVCETSEQESPDVSSSRQIETPTELDCSWWGIDVSDSEQSDVDTDGWYLVH